ncbi:MAG: rod shape-determining protein MreD [Nitrospirota bacterium]
MKYLIWPSIVFLLFILEGSISIFDVKPNLTIVLICYIGTKKGAVESMFFGSLIGLIEDSLSGTLIGPNLLSKGLLGYFSSFIYSRFFIWIPLLGIISISIFTLIDSTTVLIARSIFDRMPVSAFASVFIIGIQSLLNAPWGLLLRPKEI